MMLAEDAVDAITGEIVAEEGTKITERLLIRSRMRQFRIWVEDEETEISRFFPT